MASTEGGTEIEEVAEATPEKIVREEVDPAVGLAGLPGPPWRSPSACRARRSPAASPS
jgi:hypothetical protein